MIIEVEISELFDNFSNIRYVAVYQNDELILKQRDGVENSSSNNTDKFEELLVNPTLLKLATKRGNIDCGGLDYLIIKYGNFFQLIKQVDKGHISISLDKETNINTIPIKIINSFNL